MLEETLAAFDTSASRPATESFPNVSLSVATASLTLAASREVTNTLSPRARKLLANSNPKPRVDPVIKIRCETPVALAVLSLEDAFDTRDKR